MAAFWKPNNDGVQITAAPLELFNINSKRPKTWESWRPAYD
jgi:hypothetical protein